MFGNLFTSSVTVWGGLMAVLIALPILIHLINLVRHKTVQWAAMEFLLKSYRKNRSRVWLKQLLLLLSRIAVLLLALFLLSQFGCENDRLAGLLGGRATHHYVLVDDSFSMSDRDSRGTALDRALDTINKIVSRARSRSNHRFSLLRYSALESPDDSAAPAPVFDVENEAVDSTFASRVQSAITGIEPSTFSVDAAQSLQSVASLVKSRTRENAIVYLLSDFRVKDWRQDDSIGQSFESLEQSGAAVELIRCARSAHANIAVTDLKPIGSVRVAETPLMMEVAVTNFSGEEARKIRVEVGATVYDRPAPGTREAFAEVEELPTVFIESIEPGETQTRTFPVWFGQPGKHSVRASLGKDAVELDNQRHCVVDIRAEANVLLVDRPNRLHADFLALALNPNNMTGIGVDIETPEFLRRLSPETLRSYDVIFLCDLGQIDEASLGNLRQFVAAGGGLACFVGPNTGVGFFNHAFHEDGKGLLPVEIEGVREVEDRSEAMPADIVPGKHPIFAPVNDVGNSLLDLVQVKQVMRPSFQWLQNPPTQSKVIATLRGDRQMPLVIEGQYGKGRSMLFLTTAGPQWNNWMRNATFPPILLLLEDYLAAGKYVHQARIVGESVAILKPTGSVTPEVTLLRPTLSGERIEQKIRLMPTESGLQGRLGENPQSVLNRDSSLPGVYELWFREMDSSSTVERIALNVDHLESDLRIVDDEKLLQFVGPAASLTDWDRFRPEPKQKAVSTLNRLLLLALVMMLVLEQTLGWMCSYH